MSLLDVVRGAVKVADQVTKPLQATVIFKRCTGIDGYGACTFAASVSLRAVVEWKQKQVKTMTGELAISSSSVLFVDAAALALATPATSATAAGRVGEQDVITLPDGTTGPILALDGFADAGNGRTVYTQVYLG